MAKLNTPTPPVSKTVQRLLAQIHAEAEAATLAALSAKDGIVALQPMPKASRAVESVGARGFRVEGADGSQLLFFIDHIEDGAPQPIGPRWSAAMSLQDGSGQKWTTYFGFDFITDDFGTLVDVKGGAA